MSNPITKRHELDVKLARLRRWLAEQDLSAVVLRRRANFAWITCGGRGYVGTASDTACAAMLVTPDRLVLLASNIEADRLVEEELSGLSVEVARFDWHEPQQQQTLLQQHAGGHYLSDTDPDGVTGAALKHMRASLLEPEVDRLRPLGRLTTQIVETTCRRLAPGWSEHRVCAAVQAQASAEGARAPVCLVAADQRIARRHHPLPTTAVIRERAMVVVCIERHGLICSATRLVHFTPAAADLQRRQEAVCRVDAVAIAVTQSGRPLRDIFATIVDAYRDQGFPDEWRMHHQGGTSGYLPRETLANASTDTCIQPGQVVAWNPSIAGTKSEDTILTTTEGFEWITAPGEGWPTIDARIGELNLPRAASLPRD